MPESTPSSSHSTLSPTKRALYAIQQLQAKLDAVEAARHEPIAIVGMSCRFPGDVDSPAAFWRLLHQQTDAITEVPSDRWSMEQYYSSDPADPGKMISRYGGFIPHVYDFDASFFRIAPREAVALDPQQRLWLELGWEALENAAIAPDRLAGQSVGVFLGISSVDYWQRLLAQQPEAINAYIATGNTHSVAAGRLSFLLGATGPSMAVDAACASSLVAVHLACQSLRQGECHLAIAGGVNRIITPEASITFSKARMLSADGRCRTFDQAASGFGRAEGGGAVVLKRLSDAQNAGDRVDAVILGSAVNHDGQTSGLTVPNGLAQQAVIRQALQASRVAPDAVGYVETHGTGTALGDPIEVDALGAVFGDRSPERPLILGAVKTNIGHSEAAAGMAGLIKAAIAVQQDHIPANLHLHTPSPHIDWCLPIKAPHSPVSWLSDAPRVAGVSAFGFSGSNAHLILAAPSEVAPTRSMKESAEESQARVLPLSARTPTALRQLAARYAQYLALAPDLNLADLCYTASVGRSHFAHRLAIVASTLPDLRQALVDFLASRPNPAWWSTGSNLEPDSILQHIAQRYTQGEDIPWSEQYGSGHRSLSLPTYPFQRQRYSIDTTP